jgi:hypothetical protein
MCIHILRIVVASSSHAYRERVGGVHDHRGVGVRGGDRGVRGPRTGGGPRASTSWHCWHRACPREALVHNLYFANHRIYVFVVYLRCRKSYGNHVHIYLPMSLTCIGSSSCYAWVDGSVSNLPLLTIDGYYYTHDKMIERKNGDRGRDMVWVLMGVTGCVPRPRGIVWLHCFPIHVDWGMSVAVDGSQVTDLLSWEYTCLWEREDSFLSCRGFRLFLDWLIGGGKRWRYKHRTKTRYQVWGLGVQV